MECERDFFEQRLYPFQDRALRAFAGVDTGFYLTGGTAASRGYLHHRFSDDLDLFVNDDARFTLWSERLIAVAAGAFRRTEVLLREQRFVRFEIAEGDLTLKVELVDDVPAHVGEIRTDPVLGRLDAPENILANKLTALVDRREPKDLADVWGFCCKQGLSLQAALEGAQGKAVGLFPPDVARALLEAERTDWELVRWVSPPDAGEYLAAIRKLGEGLIVLGR